MSATYSGISHVYSSAFAALGYQQFYMALNNPVTEIFKKYRDEGGNFVSLSYSGQEAFLGESENIRFMRMELSKRYITNGNNGQIAFLTWEPGASAATAACRPKYIVQTNSMMFENNTSNVDISGPLNIVRTYKIVNPLHLAAKLIVLTNKMSDHELQSIRAQLESLAVNLGVSDDDRFDAQLVLDENII